MTEGLAPVKPGFRIIISTAFLLMLPEPHSGMEPRVPVSSVVATQRRPQQFDSQTHTLLATIRTIFVPVVKTNNMADEALAVDSATGAIATASNYALTGSIGSLEIGSTSMSAGSTGTTASVRNGTGTSTNNDKATIAKLSVQLKRLTDANAKYKSLLKMAKDRIEKQEKESDALKLDLSTLEERIVSISDEREAAKSLTSDETIVDDRGNILDGESNSSSRIVRVCLRVKQNTNQRERDSSNSSSSGGFAEEIWALIQMQIVNEDGMYNQNNISTNNNNRMYKEWVRFEAESQLQDFIRRDTGEPITLPPYSLSAEESALLKKEANSQISKVTEEFRRFRVRSELARKQADAQIRDLQNSNAQKAANQIEGPDSNFELEQARSASNQLERVKADMVALETHWKESYDALLTENNALKSAGSEALLAAQWRQRYENCLKEKEHLESRLNSNHSNTTNGDGDDDGGKYEVKYRDLKGEICRVAYLLSSTDSFVIGQYHVLSFTIPC